MLLSGRIRAELPALEQTVRRAEQAMDLGRSYPESQRFYIDSAALSMHDFYTGLERVFQVIAQQIDRSVPEGRDWHRELLRQMSLDVPNVRPLVLPADMTRCLDEYLRFRHVVRNVYAFDFDAERIGQLAAGLGPCFEITRDALLAFAEFVEGLAQSA